MMRLIGTAAPIVYVWSLPLLSNTSFANRCDHWPHCAMTGTSVSDFISTQQATGAMGATFFYPSLYMWLNVHQERNIVYKVRGAKESLMCFQCAFGAFLTCPLHTTPVMHSIAVNFLCFFGLLHYGLVLRVCAARRFGRCVFFLGMGIACYVSIFFLAGLSNVMERCSSFLERDAPWLFYVLEATGLSSMAVFPMLWFVEREEQDIEEKERSRSGSLASLPEGSQTGP